MLGTINSILPSSHRFYFSQPCTPYRVFQPLRLKKPKIAEISGVSGKSDRSRPLPQHGTESSFDHIKSVARFEIGHTLRKNRSCVNVTQTATSRFIAYLVQSRIYKYSTQKPISQAFPQIYRQIQKKIFILIFLFFMQLSQQKKRHNSAASVGYYFQYFNISIKSSDKITSWISTLMTSYFPSSSGEQPILLMTQPREEVFPHSKDYSKMLQEPHQRSERL